MNPRLLTILLLVLPCAVMSQTSYPFKIATVRMLFHDMIDNQQKLLLDKNDSLKLSNDETINLQVADVLLRQVDELQEKIELDSTLTSQEKVKSLKGIETMLKGYNRLKGGKDYPVSMAPAMHDALKECLVLDRNGKSIEPVIA